MEVTMTTTETRPIHRVLSRLHNVHQRGENYTACCPAHNDKTPSLSVSEGDDGRVLLKCWTGCKTEDIVAAIGLSMSDLFPEPFREPMRPIAPRPRRSELFTDAKTHPRKAGTRIFDY